MFNTWNAFLYAHLIFRNETETKFKELREIKQSCILSDLVMFEIVFIILLHEFDLFLATISELWISECSKSWSSKNSFFITIFHVLSIGFADEFE